MVTLIETGNARDFSPVTQTRFIWEITVGAYDAFRRAKRLWSDVSVWSSRFEKSPFSYLKNEYPIAARTDIAINSRWIARAGFKIEPGTLAFDKDGTWLYCASDLDEDSIRRFSENDTAALKSRCKTVVVDDALVLHNVADLVKLNPSALKQDFELFTGGDYRPAGDKILIHKNAVVRDYVSLRPSDGRIVIDDGAVVGEFTLIEGPAYIGRNARIDQAKIRGGTSIGGHCRIGGEVEESVVEAFSNKHHEGFLGHSYLGSWVNIGAIATTSDLKNNYGSVRIDTGEGVLDTGTNKFGSVVCDYAKIGIGMMLNTGTVVAPGCNLFQENKPLPKFVQAFSWGTEKRYDIDRFIADTKTVMERRGQTLSESRESFLRHL